MARANLSVDLAIIDAFLAAQECGSSTRCLKIGIVDEKLVLQSLGTRTSSADKDFENVLLSSVSDTEAALILFSLSETEAGKANNMWLFLAWIPDCSKVREKMLYSSSKEDLKRSLGQGYFVAEFSANNREDLTWKNFQDSLMKGRSSDMLSQHERSVFEERIASHVESNNSKSTARNVLPFQLSPELRAKFAEFKNKSSNWIEMTVEGETVSLVGSQQVPNLCSGAGTSLQSYVSDSEARFIMARQARPADGELSFFIFSCPEGVPIRQKMVMSSSKATVISIATEAGLLFDRNVEIRATADVDESLRSELEPEALGASSAAASAAHSKPTRPGMKNRSSKPTAKFVSEE